MGGALSVISYIDIKNAKIFDVVKVITFGAPRVGNKQYADNFDTLTGKSSKRFIVKGDPITVLPSCLTFLCNYKQTGMQYVCTEDDGICQGGLPVPDGILGRLAWKINADPSQQHLDSIIDHIKGYPKIYNHTLIEK